MDTNPYSLTGSGLALFEELTASYGFAPGELAILVNACRTSTLIDTIQDALADAPPTVMGAARQPVAQPLYGEIRQQRATFARLLAQLNLPELDSNGQAVEHTSAQSLRAKRAAEARWSRISTEGPR